MTTSQRSGASSSGFEPSHVLSYEKDGKMVEALVRMEPANGDEGQALLTKEDWAAHSVPDWTFESDGRLYYCGVDYALERGKCGLRTVGKRPVPLDTVLLLIRAGRRSFMDIAQVMHCSPEEIATAAATLERAGELVLDGDDRASPVWRREG